MANIVAKAAGGNWKTGATWVGEAVPGGADTAVLDGTSGNVTGEAAMATIGGYDMTGYAETLALGAFTVDVDGDAIIGDAVTSTSGSFDVSGDVTVIAGTTFPLTATINFLTAFGTQSVLDANEVALGPVVNSATGGTSKLKPGSGEDLSMVLFQQDTADSTYDGVSPGPDFEIKPITLTGVAGTGADLLLEAGLASGMVITQAGTGDVKTSASGRAIDHLTCAASGKTTTLTDSTFAHKLTLGPGTLAKGVKGLTIYTAGHQNDNFWTQHADNTFTASGGNSVLFWSLDDLNNGRIVINDADLGILPNNTKTLTMTGHLTVTGGDLSLSGWGANSKGSLDLNGNNLTCDAVVLGNPANVDREGYLYLGSGQHTIASIAAAKPNDDDNQLHLETSTIRLGGTLDGAGITFTNDSAKVIGGTIQNVDCSSTWALIAYGSTDGAGNSNVLFGSPGGFFWRMAGPMTGPMAEAA